MGVAFLGSRSASDKIKESLRKLRDQKIRDELNFEEKMQERAK